MRDHDCFEALAGAVMLGEASEAERESFAAHERECAGCGLDVGYAAAKTAAVERARDGETWRPSVTTALLERIADSRGRRERRTIGAFGWAIALSIAINAAFATGMSGRLLAGFDIGRSDTHLPAAQVARRVAVETRACEHADEASATTSEACAPAGTVPPR